ncbi:MAG: hypothetical protein ACREQF_03815, partial [Candidatus Binataceae bacterium]
CQVSDDWLRKLEQVKDDLEFAIFGVLIDVGSSELSTLAKFSDRVTSLTKLTDEGAREIFLSV